MVKADAKVNYYAVLEISPNADTDEIKKQFRKLARLYHPDRNPGKELEYVPKFQAIQAAQEILSDPEQRAKYDADRRKLAHASTGGRPAPPPRQGASGFGRSPYEAYSNFPPPRMRTQAGQPPPRPTSYAGPPPGAAPTAPRTPNFANFRPPPPRVPPRQAYAKDDAEMRKTAWEQMRHQQQDYTFSDDDGLRKQRAARDAANVHTNKPGLGRSNTTKPSRKPGFDPKAPFHGDWEPQARSTSSYASPYRDRPPPPPPPPPTAPSPPPPASAPHESTQKTKPFPPGAFRVRSQDDTAPFAEGNPRVSTPYASQGIGQKTYFNMDNLSRSSSVRDAPELSRQATTKGPSPRANAGRHRSVSPPGRAASAQPSMRRSSAQPSARKNPGFDLGYSSSDDTLSDAGASPSSDTSTKPMSGQAANLDASTRPKAKPGRSWKQRSDSPLNNQTDGAQNPAHTPVNGSRDPPPMYGKFPFQLHFISSATPRQQKGSSMMASAPLSNVAPSWVTSKAPTWATSSDGRLTSGLSHFTAINKAQNVSRFFPSMVSAASSAATTKPKRADRPQDESDRLYKKTATGAALFPQYSLNAEALTNHRTHRFSFSTRESDGMSGARSSSMDDTNAHFSTQDWNGKFQGDQNFVSTASSRKSSKVRGSSTQRPGLRVPPSPIDLSSEDFKVPPPPPNPPHSADSSVGGVPLSDQPPRPVKFSKEQWENTLKQQTFFYPPTTEGRPPSPLKSSVTGAKKGKNVRGRKQSRSEGKAPRTTTAVSSDAEDEESEAPTERTKHTPAPSPVDGDAMDIDETPPQTSASVTPPHLRKGPRLVQVPPQRAEWRDASSTLPHPAAGSIPQGAVPSAVPNAAIPPPPPPPPPQISNIKQKRDASLNLDSLYAAAPLTPSGNGIQGMSELFTALPFDSQASNNPGKACVPRNLNLPPVPRAPNPPHESRITNTQWREYMSAFAFYMSSWYQFDEKMLRHFNQRHLNAAKFGTGTGASVEATKALEAHGEGIEGDGLLSYLRGLDEDVKVQKHWDVARERHRFAIETLLNVKKRIFNGEMRIQPES